MVARLAGPSIRVARMHGKRGPATRRREPAGDLGTIRAGHDVDGGPERHPDAGTSKEDGRRPSLVAIVVAAILLVALIIFIAENSQNVTISFLGAHGTISLALAILIAAVAGVLISLLVGSTRILQLRLEVQRHRRAETPEGSRFADRPTRSNHAGYRRNDRSTPQPAISSGAGFEPPGTDVSP